MKVKLEINIEITERQLEEMRDFYPHEDLLSDEDFVKCVCDNMLDLNFRKKIMSRISPEYFDPNMF